MANRIKWNMSAFTAVRNSAKVQADLLERVERIKRQAEASGGNFTADVRPGNKRAHARVEPADIQTKRSNAKHNTLLKSMDAGK